MPDSQYRFGGFSEPTFTQIPDVFFDEIAPNLTEAELRCLIYIMRRTFGFKKSADNISLKQLVKGITATGGRILDQGTGMSKSAVARGLAGLVEKGIVTATRNASPQKGDLPTTYTLHFAGEGVSFKRTRGVPLKEQGGVLQEDTQKTVKQETVDNDPRIRIEPFIRDFAGQLKDTAPLSSSLTRVVNLYEESDHDLDSFVDILYEARRKTLGSAGVRNRMAFFLTVLERDVSCGDQPTT